MQTAAADAAPDQIADEAIRRYLWELDRAKISAETAVYRRKHAEIAGQYLGEYIAIHNGEIVDHDLEFNTLRRRIRARFGRAAVMMTLVEKQSDMLCPAELEFPVVMNYYRNVMKF
jgi:hypothetical protein